MQKYSKTQFSTINEYIDAQEESVKVLLQQIRQCIKKAAPKAE